MKQKRDYVNVLVLLALSSLVMQNSAASDISWWSRWAPSKETLTGMACAATLAVYAQRFLAQRAQKAKLPAYSYFIPGTLGTAVGTFARSDQGWGQALLQSLWHNAPALAVAALLWSGDYLKSAALQNDQRRKPDSVLSKFKEYDQKLLSLKYNFQDALKESNISKKQPTILKALLKLLKDQYNEVIAQYDALANDFVEYIRSHPNDESVKKLAMLTPAEVLYARYLPYMLKQPFTISQAQLSSDDKKQLVVSLSSDKNAFIFIQQLQEAGFDISHATKDFLLDFQNIVNNIGSDQYAKAIFLTNEIVWNIYSNEYKQQVLLEEKRTVPDEKDRLQGLMNEYPQKMDDFIEQLFSEISSDLDKKYEDILALYKSLQESITWLRSQGVSDLPEMSSSLKPYDYIYAAVNARIIKPYVKFILQENNTHSLNFIYSKMHDLSINKKVLKVVSKSELLKRDINAANDKKDNDRSVRLMNKVIRLINDAKRSEKSEDDLLESALHEALDQ